MFTRVLLVLFLLKSSQGFRLSRLNPIRTSLFSAEVAENDLTAIRKEDFPLLQTEAQPGKRILYLDSAATSQKPAVVIDALSSFYREYNANVHRGAYSIANRATEQYELARERVRDFVNAKHSDEIIFTRGATEAINIVALGFGQSVRAGDEIVCTAMEHHSNLVPWQLLAQRSGAALRIVGLTSEGELDLDYFRSLLSEKTRLVTVTHISNVLGCENSLTEIVSESHRVGAAVLVDGCQSLPHRAVDVQALDVDFFAASGHKLCGPMGSGFLFAKRERLEAMPPVFGGGEMVDRVDLESSTFAAAPLRFEAGTPSVADAIGLGVACEYLKGIGMERITQHDRALSAYLMKLLQSHIDGLSIYGPKDGSRRTSLVSFNVADCHATDISFFLDQEGICVRAGHHCAQPLHRLLNAAGSLRASLFLYNDKKDVDFFVKKLREVVTMLRQIKR